MKKTIVFINFVIFQIVFRAHRMQFWKPCLKLFYQKSKKCLLQIGKKVIFEKKSPKIYFWQVEYSFDNHAEIHWLKIRNFFAQNAKVN